MKLSTKEVLAWTPAEASRFLRYSYQRHESEDAEREEDASPITPLVGSVAGGKPQK